jgi:hypothetical protein
MTLMWIADAILLLVVIPVVLVILQQVLDPILQIHKYADDIAEQGAKFGQHLDVIVDELVQTRDLVKTAGPEIGRYLNALDQVR